MLASIITLLRYDSINIQISCPITSILLIILLTKIYYNAVALLKTKTVNGKYLRESVMESCESFRKSFLYFQKVCFLQSNGLGFIVGETILPLNETIQLNGMN